MFNPDYIGLVLGNRTIVDYAGPRKLTRGKVRDYYVFECVCSARWVDIFGNIKARGHGACKACSTKGGSGARIDFIGRVYNDREIVEQVEWREDSQGSRYRTLCGAGHEDVVTLETAIHRGCKACWDEQLQDEAAGRVGTVVNGHKILRYLGRKPYGKDQKPRGKYRYRCRCGGVHEDVYSNIVHRTDFETCRKRPL